MKFEDIKQEQFASDKECLEKAKALYKIHRKEIENNLQKPIDGLDEPADYPNAIRYFLKRVPEEELEHYWGHGITKNSAVEQLAAAISILENKTMRGDEGRLAKSEYVNAYRHGTFMVISKKDKALTMRDENKKAIGLRIDGHPVVKIDVGVLAVNAKFYPFVEDLKQTYPDTKIIYANEIPKYFETKEDDID